MEALIEHLLFEFNFFRSSSVDALFAIAYGIAAGLCMVPDAGWSHWVQSTCFFGWLLEGI